MITAERELLKNIERLGNIMALQMKITKEEWLKQCAARYIEVAGVDQDMADNFAAVDFEVMETDGEYQDPAEAADADLECWD
jgi:tellurite resistance protein